MTTRREVLAALGAVAVAPFVPAPEPAEWTSYLAVYDAATGTQRVYADGVLISEGRMMPAFTEKRVYWELDE